MPNTFCASKLIFTGTYYILCLPYVVTSLPVGNKLVWVNQFWYNFVYPFGNDIHQQFQVITKVCSSLQKRCKSQYGMVREGVHIHSFSVRFWFRSQIWQRKECMHTMIHEAPGVLQHQMRTAVFSCPVGSSHFVSYNGNIRWY